MPEKKGPSQLSTAEKVGVGTAAVSVSAAKGVGRIIGAGFKAPVLLTHDTARGFHNIPRLYGDETVREVDEIRDLGDGLRAAGKVSFFFYILSLFLFVFWVWMKERDDIYIYICVCVCE